MTNANQTALNAALAEIAASLPANLPAPYVPERLILNDFTEQVERMPADPRNV